jgi:RimJ/RimL family protein N-acetyltransferase
VRVTAPRRTPRLVLRPLRVGDGPAVLAYRSVPEVARYLMQDPMADLAEAEAFVAERLDATSVDNDHDRVLLGIEHEGELVGEMSLRYSRLQDRQGEVGWVLRPDLHGRGLATEAAREVITMAFDELECHRVFAQLDPRNTASARVCERLGMRLEAHLREESWFKGEWGDLLVYAVLKREWSSG